MKEHTTLEAIIEEGLYIVQQDIARIAKAQALSNTDANRVTNYLRTLMPLIQKEPEATMGHGKAENLTTDAIIEMIQKARKRAQPPST